MVSLWHSADKRVEVVQLNPPQDLREVDSLVELFKRIAATEGWQPGDALDQWKERSVYFALKVSGQLAGGLQLVRPDTRGLLPCATLWPEVISPSSPWRSVHVAILALDTAYRGEGILFWHLAVEMWRHCVGHGIATLFIEVTPRVLPLYQRLGWPLAIRGELRCHWGEACYLCTLGIPEVAATLLERAEHSAYYRQVIAQAFRVTMLEKDGTLIEPVREAA